jgi:hypothetical protein
LTKQGPKSSEAPAPQGDGAPGFWNTDFRLSNIGDTVWSNGRRYLVIERDLQSGGYSSATCRVLHCDPKFMFGIEKCDTVKPE